MTPNFRAIKEVWGAVCRCSFSFKSTKLAIAALSEEAYEHPSSGAFL